MLEFDKPLKGLIVEIIGSLGLFALYIDRIIRPVFDLTWAETTVTGVALLGLIYWGSEQINESDYTHEGLIWNRIIKPGYRAAKDTATKISKKFPVYGFILDFLKRSQERREAKQVVDEFVNIAFEELSMKSEFRPSGDEMDALAVSIATGSDHLKRDGYREIAQELFQTESRTAEKIRLVLIFCREYIKYDKTLDTDESIHDIQSGISRALSVSRADFEQWNEPAERLLASYGNAYDAIHHDEPCSSDPLSGTPNQPAKNYYGDFLEYFLPFRDRNALSQELVATIIDVVDRGELDQSAVARDIEEKVQTERKRVQEELNTRDAYLLLSMDAGLSKGSDEREKIYQRFPNHIQFGKTRNLNEVSELPEDIYLTTDVIFTNRDYHNTEAFLAEVTDIMPDESLDSGLVSAYELSLESPAYEPSKEDARKHLPQYTRDSLNALEYLETGDSSRVVTEIAINNLLGKKIRVRDLLAAIPVNVFVDAPPNQRNVVDAAYEDMKEQLGVEELYDWGRFDVEDVAPLLVEQDAKNGDERVASDEEWEEIAEEMIESARECERAARS